MGKPTLAFATTQYNNTPDAVPGWVRMGVVNHWTLGADTVGQTIAQSPVALKNGLAYPVRSPKFEERLAKQAAIGPLFLECEVNNARWPNPHMLTMNRDRLALGHIATIRRLVEFLAPVPIVAEYTNAFPRKMNAGWVFDHDGTMGRDAAAWSAMGKPGHHTAAFYGVPGLMWHWHTHIKLQRMKAAAEVGTTTRRPINAVLSPINQGKPNLTPEQVAKAARFIAPRLDAGDTLIVAASEDEDFETHMMPVLRAVGEAVA